MAGRDEKSKTSWIKPRQKQKQRTEGHVLDF